MLRIRPEQMKVFEQDMLKRFKEEMVEHSKEFSPELCNIIGEEQLRVALKQAMKRANEYGFSNRGPIRLYIDMMFLFGSDFDTDPQYLKLTEILKRDEDQMQRAEALYGAIDDYHEQVIGSDACYVYHALQALPNFASEYLIFPADIFVTKILSKMKQMYPQKGQYVGNDGLKMLILEGRKEAQKYRFPATTSRGEVLLIALMFSFGHGCTNDPLYPWISQTLHDKKILDPADRIKRLGKKALTWLHHVLDKQEGGA